MRTKLKKPRPYQWVGIHRAVEGNLLLGDDCGLGKTLQAVEASKELPRGPRLVVCPKRLKGQWVEEILDQEPNITKVFVLGTAGSEPDDPDFSWEAIRLGYPCWVITHYESLLRIGDLLATVPWRLVVADEVHRIKNRKAKQTLWLKQIRGTECRKIGLSATLMEKRPSDLWSPLNWIEPKVFTSYWAWQNEYDDVERPLWADYPVYIGPKNQEQMAERISPYVLIRTKSDVAPELPPKIVQNIPIEMTRQQKALYDRIAVAKDLEVDLRDFQQSMKDGSGGSGVMVIANTLTHIIRLQQATSDPHNLGFEVPSAKVEWVMDFLDDNPKEVVVIFTRFRDTATRLAGLLKASLLVGGMSDPTVSIAPFLTGQNRILVGTIDAMGEGLNLQMASTAVFLDQHWSSIKMRQAVDRIHRINITEPKHIMHLHCPGTVDELVLDALAKKQSDRQIVERFLKEEY